MHGETVKFAQHSSESHRNNIKITTAMAALTERSLDLQHRETKSLTFIRLHYLSVAGVCKTYCMYLFTFRILYCQLVCLQSKHQRRSMPSTIAVGPTVALIGLCLNFLHILQRTVKSRTKSETF